MKKMSLIAMVSLFMLSGCQSYINGYRAEDDQYRVTPESEAKKAEEKAKAEEEAKEKEPTYAEDGTEIVNIPENEDLVAQQKETMGKIISETPLDEYDHILTEKEAWQMLEERNLLDLDNEDYWLIGSYDMDGELVNKKITEPTDEKHPMYRYDLVTGQHWMIYIIGDQIIVERFNGFAPAAASAVAVEDEILVSYNSVDQTFIKYDPDYEFALVDRIDRETLNNLSTVPRELIPQYTNPSATEKQMAGQSEDEEDVTYDEAMDQIEKSIYGEA